MIAIPNMNKPNGCGKCEVWSLCHYPKVDGGYDDKVMPDCPLIDIVQCKDCKWGDTGIDEEGKPYGGTKPTDFCSYGERRSE